MERRCEVCGAQVDIAASTDKYALIVCSEECSITIYMFEHTHLDHQYHKIGLEAWLKTRKKVDEQ